MVKLECKDEWSTIYYDTEININHYRYLKMNHMHKKEVFKHVKTWTIVSMVLLMQACSTGYMHVSDPTVANDGLDLICQKGTMTHKKAALEAAVCKDVSGTKGTYGMIGAWYRW